MLQTRGKVGNTWKYSSRSKLLTKMFFISFGNIFCFLNNVSQGEKKQRKMDRKDISTTWENKKTTMFAIFPMLYLSIAWQDEQHANP